MLVDAVVQLLDLGIYPGYEVIRKIGEAIALKNKTERKQYSSSWSRCVMKDARDRSSGTPIIGTLNPKATRAVITGREVELIIGWKKYDVDQLVNETVIKISEDIKVSVFASASNEACDSDAGQENKQFDDLNSADDVHFVGEMKDDEARSGKEMDETKILRKQKSQIVDSSDHRDSPRRIDHYNGGRSTGRTGIICQW
eukprot:CAMPEP_0116021876 /NCGR_PEP_ID=MMETSP0321-20121206/10649_1 /TAXON_ID=163516 /ORGANISM="Leptocylindrus danicus var. danicus, Strain B650" /LENGTH=198 /DNA_ID=CAMNT_0003492833 /DNA_START=304 /DNA_END=897 /DNA_ORIENTATION=+